ncbi:hemerythrin domain-containing protein [Nocardioides coralli]|uniref:hemerythrin domain-containing protein n=1 Tax=Nocardioides coralli TaxID=2872154 RepID=UPI001CA3C29D|nr:hemerythrin domain-containing protein [Nocardioides coralli]QZY29494.1 hemerythrin domain-containing protein [Nocardioides coralli]
MAQPDMNIIVHNAVRRDLARMEAALRSFPEGDADRARQLHRAWAELWEHLHHHHQGEDEIVWPWARTTGAVDAWVIDAMESEHQAMSAAMEAATSAVAALVAEPTGAAAASAADRVAAAREVTEAHLRHEERDVVPLLLPLLGTPAGKAVEKQLQKDPLSYSGRFLAWVQDGADAQTLADLRAAVPPPVLLVLSKGFGRAYHREVAPVWR